MYFVLSIYVYIGLRVVHMYVFSAEVPFTLLILCSVSICLFFPVRLLVESIGHCSAFKVYPLGAACDLMKLDQNNFCLPFPRLIATILFHTYSYNLVCSPGSQENVIQ